MEQVQHKISGDIPVNSENNKPNEIQSEQQYIPESTAPNAELATDIFKQALELKEKLEIENKKSQELLRQNEALYTRMVLSGRSEAGIKPKSQAELMDEEVKRTVSKFIR